MGGVHLLFAKNCIFKKKIVTFEIRLMYKNVGHVAPIQILDPSFYDFEINCALTMLTCSNKLCTY